MASQIPDSDGETEEPEEPEGQEDAQEDTGKGLGLSLKDIFEDEEEVDETLRDLADSLEEIEAADLASELADFLNEMESRMN